MSSETTGTTQDTTATVDPKARGRRHSSVRRRAREAFLCRARLATGCRLRVRNRIPDLQFTPPGSPCSIQFGTNVTTARPGSAQGLYLIVTDIEAARAELVARGAKPSAVFHPELPGAQFQPDGAKGTSRRPATDHQSYRSFVTFSDPDGNGWLLQEITQRLPGRGTQPRRLDVDGASAGDRGTPWCVRADGSEASLVGMVRRVHRRTRAR
jgi:hypothetical protein